MQLKTMENFSNLLFPLFFKGDMKRCVIFYVRPLESVYYCRECNKMKLISFFSPFFKHIRLQLLIRVLNVLNKVLSKTE